MTGIYFPEFSWTRRRGVASLLRRATVAEGLCGVIMAGRGGVASAVIPEDDPLLAPLLREGREYLLCP